MIKTGVYKIEDIRNGKDITFYLKDHKKVSITLYNKIMQEPDAEELAERILLTFTDDRGAYKRTYNNRFEQFDSAVIDLLAKHFSNSRDLILLDIGISDGRTSLDLFKKIALYFPKIRFYASDYDPKVYTLKSRKCTVTINRFGKVLEILYPPFVFSETKIDSCKLHPINRLIRLVLKHTIVSQVLDRYKKGEIKAEEILLFSPKVLNTARDDKRFVLMEYNLLEPFKEQVQVVRAMNVLNKSYFSTSEFNKILQNIYDSLHDGGLFITGSNQGAGTTVDGAVYIKKSERFKEIFRSGKGSQIGDIILDKVFK